MQSVLRWAGSKRLLLPQLRSFLPSSPKRYVEAFAGSAALFFSEEPSTALLADLNRELVTTYRALRDDALLVLQCFRRLPRGPHGYYSVRANHPTDRPDSEIAARFLYLNRFCFNGLYRTNMAGHFNVPYGPPVRPLSNFAQRVLDAGRLLKRVTLRSQDFEATVAEAQEGDFFYLDPPYAVDDRRIFREYLPGTFSRLDISRLRRSLEFLDDRGVPFLLSYAAGPDARRLASGWHTTRVLARRHVAGFVSSRRRAVEVLISNRPLERRSR